MGLEQKEFKTYASVIADGSIRVKTDEADPEAVKREITLKDGTKMTKFEKVYSNLRGMLKNVEFRDGEFGTQVIITIDDINLALSMKSNYADDFLKKLPNVDLSQEVNLKPFSFVNNKNKKQRGMTIEQGDGKVANFFYDTNKEKNINGFPEFPKDYKGMSKDDWDEYFLGVRKFLKKYTEDNIMPKFVKDEELEESSIEDIQFES